MQSIWNHSLKGIKHRVMKGRALWNTGNKGSEPMIAGFYIFVKVSRPWHREGAQGSPAASLSWGFTSERLGRSWSPQDRAIHRQNSGDQKRVPRGCSGQQICVGMGGNYQRLGKELPEQTRGHGAQHFHRAGSMPVPPGGLEDLKALDTVHQGLTLVVGNN